MARKLTLLLATAAVIALAAPAFASAAAAVTSSPGVLAKVGTKLTASSTNMVTKTSLGNLTCAKFAINGEITENTGSSFKAKGIGAGETSTCKLGTKSITFTDVTATSIVSTVTGQGTADLTWEADLPNGVVCHFTGSTLPFTYVSGSDVMTFNAADMVATPAACEPGLLNGNFTATIVAGLGLILD